jgi:hypothetical protein
MLQGECEGSDAHGMGKLREVFINDGDIRTQNESHIEGKSVRNENALHQSEQRQRRRRKKNSERRDRKKTLPVDFSLSLLLSC